MKKQICTFNIDDMRLGLDVSHVQEILREQEITDVPLAPPMIAGLLNLRGQIVMVTDLKVKFSVSNMPCKNPIFLILKSEEGPTCFRVDKVGDVIEIDEDFREPVPPQLAENIRNCAMGVYSDPDGLIVELLAEKLCESQTI